MQGHNFAHRAAARPNSTSQNNKPHTSQYTTPNQQQTRHPDVRQFKQANRLAGLFTSAAERTAHAEAASKASQSARRTATSRLQKENVQDQAERAAKLAEERECIAKELAEKHAALENEEISRKERQRVAAIREQDERFRKAKADKKAVFVPDTMWPRENWQGVVFGDDFRAFKRSQEREANSGLTWEERMERAFNERRPKSSGTSNTAPPPTPFPQRKKVRKHQGQRDFDDEDPDDCWGFNATPPAESQPGWEWAESPPVSYNSGYGSPPASSPNPFNSDDHDSEYNNNGYTTTYNEMDDDSVSEDDGDDGSGWFFEGEEWENFKKSWYGHSRQHHHRYHYSANFDFGFGSGSTRGGGGGGAGYHSSSVHVCQQSATRAAQRAVETARNGLNTTAQGSSDATTTPAAASGAQEDVDARKQEIQSAVISAAQHSGNDIAAFASALKIHVDHSKGQEHAKKMAKKGLLMTFHPDKLARAGVLEQYLGQCVTQLILTSVK